MFFFFFDDDDNKISPHTIKKFELISAYVETWIQKLMNYPVCNGIVYIDCMSNSGVYHDNDGNEIEGTPIRVANIIREAMTHYPNKQAYLYFNDWSKEKIDVLKKRLPENSHNFHIQTSNMDGNDLLRQLGSMLSSDSNLNYLLVYDPYQAAIDWGALRPFLRTWGEVIINHMVLDSVRATKIVKRPEKIEKYENTYLTDIEELVSFGSDKEAFEKRIEEIIRLLSGSSARKYYVASFPFFNKMNAVVYNLIHCTGSIQGFKLYKTTAWKIFGNRSSIKNTHRNDGQLVLRFDEVGQEAVVTAQTDEYCYCIDDIVRYVQNKFKGRRDVALNEVWGILDEHPIFPSDGYKKQIKDGLKVDYGAIESKGKMTFSDRSV